MDRHLFIGCVNFVDNTVIADSDSVKLLGSRQFNAPVRERVVPQFFNAQSNSLNEGRRNSPEIFVDGRTKGEIKGGHPV
jgi:hypothetical protein